MAPRAACGGAAERLLIDVAVPDHRRMSAAVGSPYRQAMETRNFGYLGVGMLVAIVGVTVIGVPPEIWIPLTVIAGVVGAILVVRKAQADGIDIAGRILARGAGQASHASVGSEPVREQPSAAHDIDVELVRAADEAAGLPAVWLHRRGGRRVHRFATAHGWVVQQVSTKDPDNPRKRVIGEARTVATEAQAIEAADELARGRGQDAGKASRVDRPTFSVEAHA